MRGTHGWRVAARTRVRPSGKFSRRIRLVPTGHRNVIRLRAVQSTRKSKAVEVRVDTPVTLAPTATSTSTCALGQPGYTVEMSLPGCPAIASDTSADSNPIPFWGSIGCQDSSRYAYSQTGGDTHATASGAAQPDSAYRRLTVQDGDNFYGERCELGENDHNSGPTAFYHEGQHRITYFSERLPDNFPLSTNHWQTVMQMKQAQPSDGGGGVPILFMGAYEGQWQVLSAVANDSYFTFPAQTGVWTRFAWDVYYSQDPSKGWLQVSADLNDDGDFDDPGERSPVIHGPTLKTEVDGPLGTRDGLAPGDPIPSHLRIGIYHDPAISCAPPTDCSVEIDNVQVVGG